MIHLFMSSFSHGIQFVTKFNLVSQTIKDVDYELLLINFFIIERLNFR
jgi:hypothetical protein